MDKVLKIRPYARLITMLGDQLIKNERIALVELIKNAYDADAEWVKVSFLNFNDDFTVNSDSKIVIEDDGNGMNEQIIEKHWLNPATPEKKKRKKIKETTDKGRILQGEKGIGRFAIFKLGKKISIYTRRQKWDNKDKKFIEGGEDVENIVEYDFSAYDEDFLEKNGEETELYIDELQVVFHQRTPQIIVDKYVEMGGIVRKRKPHGTIIEIADLKTNWTENRVNQIQKEIGKLQPIFSEEQKIDFRVWIYKDLEVHRSNELYREKLLNCLNSKAVLKITNGFYKEKEKTFSFELNGKQKKLCFADLVGIEVFKNYFKDVNYVTECGDFQFQFYIFDFKAKDTKYILDDEEDKIVKEHRIYLYRDQVRVLPYGDPDDDWLKIDMMRGTKSAGMFLSNDQVVGCVDISQKKNPLLKDKTNREGLIDEGRALEDFINLLQVLLRYFRKILFAQYLIDRDKRAEISNIKEGKPLDIIESVKKKTAQDKNTQKLLDSFEKSYKYEKEVYADRIRKTENLAAVGLSVETASHDVMIILKKSIAQINQIISDLRLDGEVDKKKLLDQMVSLENSMTLVNTQMKDIRLLFPSAKTRAKDISVLEVLEKVNRLYMRPFQQNEIQVSQTVLNGDMTIRATEAVLLQVFINLYDNALYWLKTVSIDRKINICINAEERLIIFSDNGPGIKMESMPYVFEAFYSEKGEDGRGLGLYIAQQLLNRYNYGIDVLSDENDKVLSGANFCIKYIEEE